MPTITVPRDQLHTLDAGDRIVAVDGHRLDRPHVVATLPGSSAGPVPLVNANDTDTIWNLYQDTVERDLTVERPEHVLVPEPVVVPEPEPAPAPEPETPDERREREFLAARAPRWDDLDRVRRALRRNPQYVRALRLLEPHGDDLVDVREITNAFEARDVSRSGGYMAGEYGWVEKPRAYRMRLTARGRRALRIARREGLLP
jgi:hypothetical protein